MIFISVYILCLLIILFRVQEKNLFDTGKETLISSFDGEGAVLSMHCTYAVDNKIGRPLHVYIALPTDMMH